jgi:uncharacterized membrane protein
MAANDDAGKLKGILGDIQNEMDGIKSVFDQSTSSLKSMVGAAQQFQNYQNGITKLSSDQLKNLSQKLQKEKESLQNNQQSLKNSLDINKSNERSLQLAIKELQNQKNLSKEKQNALKAYQNELDEVSKKIDKEAVLFEQVNQLLSESNDELDQLNANINKAAKNEKLNERFKKLGKTIDGIGSKLGISFTFAGVLKALGDVDKAMGDFSKSQNKSYNESVRIKKEFSDIALASGDSALNSARLMETQAAIGAQLGSNAKLNEADLKTFTKLREQAGFTNEELIGVQQLSLVNGKTLKQNTSEILGSAKAYASRNKLVVNEKQILKEVSKASASIKLSFGGSASALAKAVVQAKQFGLTLEQAEKMSQSLLNFEESIESELSAELLTGKNLNLEEARRLALNNDIAGAAEAVAKQVGTSADFAKMNAIQQESIAKAAGLTRDELAQSLMDREALAKLGAKEGQDALSRYNEMRAAGMSQAEIAKQLGDAELAKQYEQQSVQEKFNDTMLQLKETLMNGILPAFESMGTFLKENMGMVKTIVGLFIALKAAQMAYNALSVVSLALQKKKKQAAQQEATAEIFGGAFSSLGAIPVVGAILAGALVAATLASMFSEIGKADDMVSPSQGGGGYGKRMLLGPEGAISLNNKDTVIAGTDLGGGKKSSTSTSANMDMSAVVNAIAELRRDVNALANRPINVAIDGKKVIEATTGNQPNTVGDESRKNSYQIS